MSVIVNFKEDGKTNGKVFYSYQDWGKWIADNYECIDIIDVIQEE